MEPKLGDMATCSMCGQPIQYVGPYWDHIGENKPRHPAVPGEPPTKHTITLELDIATIQAHLNDAHAELSALCRGEKRFTMSVPARPTYDSDLILGAALRDADKMLAALLARREPAKG